MKKEFYINIDGTEVLVTEEVYRAYKRPLWAERKRNELFTRLIYYGTVHLRRSEEETWLTPIGLLLDLWECHCHFLGMRKPKRLACIDDVIPEGI